LANEYLNMTELIKDYYDKPVGEYLNRTVTINNVELACDIYRVAPETVLTPTVFTGCTAVDANTQIVIGRDMSVASGTTLIPPYRCKGIIIGDVGTFTNEGTISMTARGASGAGKNIQLTADYMISAVGGAGGVQTNSGNGVSGSSPAASILSCGGGGTGGSYSTVTGRGGNGTSFSGGAGSGGQSGGGSTANGSDTGGAGSAAVVAQAGGYDGIASGGVGNPGGQGANYGGTNIPAVSSGTGGLIILLCNSCNNIGSIIANGVSATEVSINYGSSGGSSGGGCVVVLTRQSVSEGTLNTDGGAAIGGSGHTYAGGAGGAGSIATLIVDDLILQNLPVEFAITDKAHLDNIEPSEAVRIIGLTDDDELQYDIMGKRHRAMNTEAEIDFSKLPSRGQRTPDAFEVDINNPQDGQSIVYNGTQQKWVNGAGGLHEYSTTEHIVGEWIDGKPLYERSFDFGTLPNKGIKVVNTDITFSTINKMIDIRGLAYRALDGATHIIPYIWWDHSGTLTNPSIIGVTTQLGSNDKLAIAVNDNLDRSNENAIITLQYTKTTD